jgi:hypothetical protein
MGKVQIHYKPEIREQHSINISDLETCSACGAPYPCAAIQICDSADYMNENGLGIDDVTTGRWISGPLKDR